MAELLELLKDHDFNTVKDIMKSFNVNTKQHKNLYMLYFSDDADFSDKIVRQANGAILEKNTNKLIHYSFEKTYEGFTEDIMSKDPYEKQKLKNFSILPYFEGSLIKVFYHDNQWRIGTSRFIDASNTKWTSKKSFMELFKEALKVCFLVEYEQFIETLIPENCYTFLLQHPENKLVCNVEHPMIFQINSFNLVNMKENLVEEDNFKLNNAVIDQTVNFNYMVYNKLEDGTIERIKVLTNDFYTRLHLRGNDPNINVTYINKTLLIPELSFEYKRLFPEHKTNFEQVDKAIENTVKNIHYLYVENFIRKNNIQIIKKYKKPIQQLHQQYIKTRKSIKEDDVYDILIAMDEKQQSQIIL